MASVDPTKMELHVTSGDWAAIYVDGKFEDQGHEHNIYEQAFELLGVKMVYSTDFLRGDGSGKSVARTTEEIEQYSLDKLNRHRLAQQKRLDAEKLLREAAELENK